MEQIDSAIQARLARGAELMDNALQMTNDLSDMNRKLVVYWTVATHMLPNVNTFPLLVLRGPMGTGKSECLTIVSKFAHNPREFPMRGFTTAMVRDEMIAAHNGTAIIEEADQGGKDGDSSFERILSDRYQRRTGKAGVKHKNGRDDWSAVASPLFGATALHKRMPFEDAALDGRSINIAFRSNFERGYVDTEHLPSWITDGFSLLQGVTFKPIEIDRPHSIAPRIFNSYLPVITTSQQLEDHPFFYSLIERLEQETAELKQAQSLEPDGIVLRAVLNIANNNGVASYGNIKLSTVVDWILSNHKIKYAPRHVGGLARSLGLTIKESHGVAVIVPTPLTLVRACHQVGYVEEEVAEMKSQIPGWSHGLFDDQRVGEGGEG